MKTLISAIVMRQIRVHYRPCAGIFSNTRRLVAFSAKASVLLNHLIRVAKISRTQARVSTSCRRLSTMTGVSLRYNENHSSPQTTSGAKINSMRKMSPKKTNRSRIAAWWSRMKKSAPPCNSQRRRKRNRRKTNPRLNMWLTMTSATLIGTGA